MYTQPSAEDEPCGWKHVERHKNIQNYNINFQNVHFVGLYCIITVQYGAKKHKI